MWKGHMTRTTSSWTSIVSVCFVFFSLLVVSLGSCSSVLYRVRSCVFCFHVSGDEDWEGYDLEIYLYEDRFGVDANVYLGTLENIVPFQVYTVSESVPAEWRTCDPAELYFYGYYDLTSSFESCRFVPENILEDAGCGAVTSPAEGDVVELAMNTITWTLDDEVWDGWNVELYLYQELSLWPDPYWYLGDALATSHELSVDLGALGVSTSADSTWYVAVYWRFGYVFTSQALPESGRFTLDDVLESICDLSVTWDSGVNLDCCASDGSLRNDLCRLSLADVSLDVVDFALDVPYNATMPCLLTAGVNVTGEVTLVYQDSDEVVTYHTAVSVSESLDFDLRTLDYSKTFQVVDLADLAFPGPAVSGLVNAILAMECTADGISAVASIQGSALIAGYQVAEQTQEVYRYEAISWPDLDAEPTSAPTAPGPTAEPTAAPTAAPTAPAPTAAPTPPPYIAPNNMCYWQNREPGTEQCFDVEGTHDANNLELDIYCKCLFCFLFFTCCLFGVL